MAKDLIQFASDPSLTEWLDGRATRSMSQGSPGMRARTELIMWRSVLTAELRRQRWTLPELGLLADVHNGVIITDGIALNIGLVAAGVIESVHEYPGIYGEKHEVDEDAIKSKLLDFGPAADHALADAIARWWQTKADHTAEGWASVGIRVHDGEGSSPG